MIAAKQKALSRLPPLTVLNRHLHKPIFSLLIATLAGAFTVLGFAPFYFYVVPFATISILCFLLAQSRTSVQAGWLGLCFGVGMYAVGLSWMIGTLHDFGEMPLWLAYLCSAILFLYLASFTAAAAWVAVYARSLWFLPFAWGIGDWLRGWICSGFPWLTMGYSQVPSSVMSSYLPVTGVYGLSIIVVGIAVLVFYMMRYSGSRRWLSVLSVFIIVGIGAGLQHITWTVKQGEPVSVALLQGNVNQQTKWSVEQSKQIVLSYLDLIDQTDARVIVLPETAFPIYLSQAMGQTRDKLLAVASEKQADILIGMLDWQDEGNWQKFNAVVNYGNSGLQIQHKSHLVPFGEFIPLPLLFAPIYEHWFRMPHNDFSVGKKPQLFSLGKSMVAISICYDDLFGHDLAKYARNAAYIVSVSNGAWFGNSVGLEQYLQFSQARAIENQKMLARASNNGVTAFIDIHGVVISRTLSNQRTIHSGYLQEYQGATLYSQWGDRLFWCVTFIALMALSGLSKCQKKFT